MIAPHRARLYLVTPETLDPRRFRPLLEQALAAGDVACVQLRLKGADDATLAQAIAELKPVAEAREVAFILNDRPDLAAATGCDGVHIGQEDTPYAEARRLIGDQGIVGVTCHASRHLAIQAAEAGADYVAFGSIFPSPTKPEASPASLDLLRWWQEMMTTPQVAIGGITLDNVLSVVEAGADFVAVASSVWQHPAGPGAAVRAFNEIFVRAGTNSAPGRHA